MSADQFKLTNGEGESTFTVITDVKTGLTMEAYDLDKSHIQTGDLAFVAITNLQSPNEARYYFKVLSRAWELVPIYKAITFYFEEKLKIEFDSAMQMNTGTDDFNFDFEEDFTEDNCSPGTAQYLRGEISADEAKQIDDDTKDW